MKLTLTKNALFTLDQEMQQIQATQPALSILLRPRINYFYDRAGVHLKGLYQRLDDIKEKYVEKDGSGKFITEEVEGKKQLKFLDSYVDLVAAKTLTKEEVQKAFNEECEKMFSESIILDL
jgi:hypothetical protein